MSQPHTDAALQSAVCAAKAGRERYRSLLAEQNRLRQEMIECAEDQELLEARAVLLEHRARKREVVPIAMDYKAVVYRAPEVSAA